MKAVGYAQSLEVTNPQALEDIELWRPVPEGRGLLIKLCAVSVHPVLFDRLDISMKKGAIPQIMNVC